MNTLFIKYFAVAAAGALQIPMAAYAASDEPTGLECGAEQSLWVYELGDRGSTPAPIADGGSYSENFETWESSDQMFWLGKLTGLPEQINAAKTLEKIILKEGVEDNVPLGTFSIHPTFEKSEFNKIGTIAPKSGVNATSFNLEPTVAALFDGAEYANELFYTVAADSQLEYVRLALCSDAPVVKVPPSGGPTKAELEALIKKLEAEKLTLQKENTALEVQLGELPTALQVEQDKNANQTTTINYLNSLLKDAPNIIEGLETDVGNLTSQVEEFSDDVDKLNAANRIWKVASGLLALLSLGLGGLLLFRPKGHVGDKFSSGVTYPNSRKNERPSKPKERREDGGVAFAGSPLAAANVATPLSQAGRLTASNLQMLTGQFAVLRPAYHATGRIGYSQEGKPTIDDYSWGTGFLITPNHVMTNRHVHGYYGHYLTADEDCGGIEFIAEKDKDASDFIPFNGEPPLLLEGLDIAIYTLSRSAGNRTPINFVPVSSEDLDGREVAVIGYPDAYDLTDEEVLAVVEDNPILAVKRISQGKIFRHSTDDAPYGVEVRIQENDDKDFPMDAICHNASTLGGNSGSPILDIKTGELLGVHFAGFSEFNDAEAANLAMAISQLTEHSDIENV